MQEETVTFTLDNERTQKEKRAAYKNVQVKMHLHPTELQASMDAIINSLYLLLLLFF